MRTFQTALLSELSESYQTLSKTKQLHAVIVKFGLSDDPFYVTRILRFYALNNDLFKARYLFDKTPQRSVYLWNSMIRAYACSHEFNHAFSLFSQMKNSKTKADDFTYACVSRALSENNDLVGLKAIHGCVIVCGLECNFISSSALVSAYSKLGLIGDARRVFDGAVEPDLVLWNSMLSAYGYGGFWRQGIELFSQMQSLGKRYDGYTLVGLVSCFCDPSLLNVGKGIHGLCLKIGLDLNAHVGSALVSMYSKFNCLDLAYQVFSSLSWPDLVLWSSLINGFSQSGHCVKALIVFTEMNAIGGKPDAILIASVLSACARLAAAGPGKEIHGYVFRHGFWLEVMVSSALIDMYGKCGLCCLGCRVFDIMQERNVVSYNSLISCLGSNGFGHHAIKVFEEMLLAGFKPDEATFSAILSACCHAGLIHEGKTFFKQMEHEFHVAARTEHYVYMVKLLAMDGELKDAYHFIQNMPILPDSGVWGALLWGCSIHGNEEMGEMVARELFEIEPEKTAYSVMLSNLYAEHGKWDDVTILRDEMAKVGLRKVPGLSWIAEAKV